LISSQYSLFVSVAGAAGQPLVQRLCLRLYHVFSGHVLPILIDGAGGIVIMARIFYTIFFYLMMPIILLRLLYRSIKAPAYAKRVLERFGLFTKPLLSDCIWVHAVSVGEVIAAAPMIKRLQQQYPQRSVMVTTMTPTGSERVQAMFGDAVFHVYAPYDLPGSIQRFLTRTSPQLLLIIETELWPNTIHYCHQGEIPTVLVNARLSARSAKGYQKFSALTSPMLQQLSLVVAQYQADGDRFAALGLPSDRLQVNGSIKFDINLPVALVEQAKLLKREWTDSGQRKVLIAASTHDGEDEILLRAFVQVLEVNPSLLLILVPRHPERFNKVAGLCEEAELQTVRRSSGVAVDHQTQVLLADTMGELLLLLGCSDISFIGGSLVANGGHNMLEAAVWGLPIITGPSDFNFLDISAKLQQAGALQVVNDAEQLAALWQSLLLEDDLAETMGAASKTVIEANRGALDRLLVLLAQYLV
jgi:3-deoxy-D-manno-octulosonic-acid transferase